MALYVTPDKKAKGEEQFQRALGTPYTRRDFLKGIAAAGGATALGAGLYFGYKKNEVKPPRLGLEAIYGKAAAAKIRVEPDYKKLLEDRSIEAVIIALPLHLH